MIGIRADANKEVATGHIMRCLTIAKELNKLGEDVLFFTADHEADGLLSSYNDLSDVSDVSDVISDNTDKCVSFGTIRHIVLESNWKDLESELPVLSEIIKVYGIDTLLVDSYLATYDYFKALRRICKVAYIDDLHESIFPVDMIINYNGYQSLWNYEAEYTDTKLLLGLDFAPLRPQFRLERTKDKIFNTDFHILLAAGGGDILHVMSSLLYKAESLDFFGECRWHVVMGSFTDNRNELILLAHKHPNIIIHEQVANMAALMSKCNIAITAAGTMLTECAAMCLPAIYYLSADNQRYEADFWSIKGQMLFAGDMQNNPSDTLKNILDNTKQLFHNRATVEQMSLELSDLVDGKGAYRIATEIKAL